MAAPLPVMRGGKQTDSLLFVLRGLSNTGGEYQTTTVSGKGTISVRQVVGRLGHPLRPAYCRKARECAWGEMRRQHSKQACEIIPPSEKRRLGLLFFNRKCASSLHSINN